jgi:hypothetical protein
MIDFDGDRLRRELSIEVARLDALLEKYFMLAMAGDIDAGTLYCKLASRKASLLGLDAPAHTTALIVHATAPPRMTSTERLRAAVDRIRGKRLPSPDDANGSENPN